MSWASRVRHFLRRLFDGGRAEDELDEEVRGWFETMVQRRMLQGMTQEEAQRIARLESGGAEQVKEKVRDARTGATIQATLQDARYALRVLRKNPGFASVAVLSLGLGLGANIAIFTLVNTVMLKSLPVKNPNRLFFVDNSGGKEGGGSGPPYPCYERLRDNNHYFSGMAAFSADRFKVTIDGAQEQVGGQYASGSYFEVLGVEAAIGRVLTPADDSAPGRGGPDGPVAVISYGLWDRSFGRNPAVLGKRIQVGTNAVTIVGVTQPGFSGLSAGMPIDVTIPMMLTNNNLRAKKAWWFSVVGRLKDGASADAARSELDGYFQAYMEEIGKKGDRFFSGIALLPAAKGLEGLRRQFSKPLLIVMAISGLVLLIGCANVANLLLARASARRSEVALRLAIGASRWRLVRQLFTEGLLLSGLAAGAGVVFANRGVAALVALFAGIRGRIVLEPHFDGAVIAFTAGVALITSLLFSIAPALHAARTDAAKPGAERRDTRAFPLAAGNVLVVVQITLSLMLLCTAALFLRSLHNLTHLDAGFQRESVVTMRVDATLPKAIPEKGKATEEETVRLGRMWEDLLAPVRGLADVRAASASTLSPMSGYRRGVGMAVSGDTTERGISLNQVSDGYFDAFGVALLAGRLFTAADEGNSPRVAILNETAARAAFRGTNPLGRRVTFPNQRVTSEYEVVGIVRDARYASLREAAGPMVYVPIQQALDRVGWVTVAIRARNAAGLAPLIRRRMQAAVPGGFMGSLATLQQEVDESLLEERLLSILASLFGGLALLLAAIGIYGTLSYTVIRRTREIGIRIAVGAERTAVLWLVLRQTLAMTGAGLALGIPLVLLAKRYVESELFGLGGTDPVAIGGAAVVLASVALAAGAWPAWRASRLDPMVSLREE